MASYTQEDIEFSADGVILRGWFFKSTLSNAKSPAIVMAHGYNCIKELYLDKYAAIFASSGFSVLVFDNRNLGDSDGEPRQELDPWQQVRDYRNAITFLQTLPEIDHERIGIWGTSYSGGHVLVVSALDKRVKCVVSQVPTTSGWQIMLRRISPDQWQQLRKDFDLDRYHRFLGHEPKLVPMIADPSKPGMASHKTADVWNFFNGNYASEAEQWRFKKWRNEVTLRSIEMYSEYEPGSYVERIAPTPLLMQIADNDVVAVTDEALSTYNRARGIKKLHLFQGGHFSGYLERFDECADEAVQWFCKHL